MKAVQHDMTVGKPMKVIINFTLPIFIGNVFQQFYNMADAVIVGKFVGTKALAAVGSTGTIMFLIWGFVAGMTAGFTVLTAQKFGAGDMDGMRKTVAGAGILSLGIGLFLTIVFMAFMKPLLILMNTPADIFQDAYKYIMIICAGIFTQVMYNLLAGILRALGNSKTPLYFLLFSAGLNIVFHLGAAGAAYATVIAQGVSALLCLVYIIKKVPILKLDRWDFKLDGHLVRQQLAIGFPMALQYSITAIGAMMVQAALNVLGSVHVAAFTAANKIEQVATQVYVALGTTMATYCAQNMGAGKVKRISRGFRATTIMGSIYSVVFGVLVFFFGNMLTGLFVSENLDQIVGLVDIYMKCVALFFIPLNVVNVYRNGIQGMGYGFLPMTAGIAELAGRGLTAVVASHYKSYLGICLASPVAWIFASALLLVMYFGIMNKYKKAGNFRE